MPRKSRPPGKQSRKKRNTLTVQSQQRHVDAVAALTATVGEPTVAEAVAQTAVTPAPSTASLAPAAATPVPPTASLAEPSVKDELTIVLEEIWKGKLHEGNNHVVARKASELNAICAH